MLLIAVCDAVESMTSVAGGEGGDLGGGEVYVDSFGLR